MKKIRFGVIGCGSIANEYHLPALRRVEGAQLVWACDLIEERAQKAKDDFGFEKYTLDYHDILNDSSIDAVCIFTKIEMHATLCIEAAAAGKHIFSQKPFAYNIEEGRKIIRAVDEAGVKLTPSFMHSYMDGSIAARRIVEEGKIGEIRHIRMRNATKNPFDSAPGYGGCMMDIGCHGVDLIHTVAGSSIEEVFALHLSPRDEKRREEFGERANLNGVENTAILNYRLASGATVFHEVFWTQVAQTNRFEMEIYGAKGVIYLYNPHRSDIVYYGWNLDGHPRKDIHWQAAPVDPQFFGYIHHKTFVDDLLNGTNNSKTARDAFVPLQVVEAARRSFESGRIERVLGIQKAYITRVGEGPFPTEQRFPEDGGEGEEAEVGEMLCAVGHEFGVTTGRKRRCGWFDAVIARYAAEVNGLTDVALTKLDVLSAFDTIKVCTAYECEGKVYDYFPMQQSVLFHAKPVYEELPGWKGVDITECRTFEELPENAQRYVEYLEKITGVPVSIIAVGPDRDQTIMRGWDR